jgi:hypothetical protein
MIVYDSSLYLNAKYMVSTNEELWSLKDTSLYTPPPPSNIQCIQANSFTLYPNPNNGNFTIELDNINFKECKVEVYDMTRRLIKSEKLISKSETISINQPKGIYLVKVQLDDKALTKQLIVD